MASNESKTVDDKCQTLLEELTKGKSNDIDRLTNILSEFRVLTRSKSIDTNILNDDCLKILVNYSRERHIEAQKCLSNLILNYAHLRENLIDPYIECLNNRLQKILAKQADQKCEPISNDKQRDCEVLYYDLRIMFLLSALCSGSRAKIRNRLLNPLLEVTSLEADNLCKQNYLLVIESLKSLFNLTMENHDGLEDAGKLIRKLIAMVGTRKLEECEEQDDLPAAQTDRLLVNLIHLLTNMPKEVYMELSDEDVDKVLTYLDEQLRSYSKESFRDTVLPVLNACANICRFKDDVRERWFQSIIASTKEFDKRPEEYDTLRGRLVKLMTSVDVHIKDIAAEFLYALCAGDTEKFITYTGFGNSAAYLSTRGLLTQSGSHGGTRFSGDIADANDEYKIVRSKLDPVTGMISKPNKDPMEGLTDEQKEWHAHELAQAIAKLSNLGVIRPMKLNADGGMSELHQNSDDRTN